MQIGNANSGNNALGTANGDVYVEVGNNLRMRGGRGEGGVLTSANRGSYAQIGNGGAQMDGLITGDTEVSVGHNLTTEDGDGGNDGYVKIGLGDWLRDNPAQSGDGDRQGDIAVKVGNTASFDHTLVGHRDSAASVGFAVDTGNTYVGVSLGQPVLWRAGDVHGQQRLWARGLGVHQRRGRLVRAVAALHARAFEQRSAAGDDAAQQRRGDLRGQRGRGGLRDADAGGGARPGTAR